MVKQTRNSESIFADEASDDIVKIVARRLQEARIRAGLTQTQLGERAGVKQSYVFELEFGATNPTLKTLEKMAKALDLDLRDLLPGAPGATASDADVKHIMLTLDRLTATLEAYLLNEHQRSEREEQRREKQETLLRESLRSVAELRFHLPPQAHLPGNGKEPDSG